MRTNAALQSCCRTAPANGRGSMNRQLRRAAAPAFVETRLVEKQQPASSSSSRHPAAPMQCTMSRLVRTMRDAGRRATSWSHWHQERPRSVPRARQATKICAASGPGRFRKRRRRATLRANIRDCLKYINSEYPPAGPQTNLRPLASSPLAPSEPDGEVAPLGALLVPHDVLLARAR